MVYIGAFLSSALFGYWATRINPKTNRGLIFLCSVISILIPSLLAGLRDVSIGTDIRNYLLYEYNLANEANNLLEYISIISDVESGFCVFVFFITKIFGDVQWVLFFIEFAIMLCIYIGAWNFRDRFSLPLVLLLYFFMYYNDSLNMLRQSMAMAIVFLSINWLLKKEYVKFAFIIFMAMQFHITAIIALVFLIIYIFLEGKRFNGSLRSKSLRGYALVVSVSVFCMMIPKITEFLTKLGILDSKFLKYVTGELVLELSGFMFIWMVEIIFVLIVSKNLRLKNCDFDFFKMNLFFAFIFSQLSHVLWFGQRLSLYFGIVDVLFLASFPKFSMKKSNKVFVTIGILMLIVAYWIGSFVIRGNSETYPYIPYWQNI